MEPHPLNLAHRQHRRAEAHMKYNRFDEAMKCHHNAAELLLDAMKSTTSSVALESITLQHSYHLKQKDLIKSKKEQYERVLKAVENLKLLSKDPESIPCADNSKLQLAIYKTLNESDTLLESLCSKISEQEGSSQAVMAENLQTTNSSLHSLVEQLVVQMEVVKDDNTTLNERIRYLEKERNKYLNLQSDIQQSNFTHLSLESENYANENELASAKRRPFGVVRPAQNAHFDLSAFKDD